MALGPISQPSPVMGTADRALTPQAQPLSKRDKRRTQLMERLQDLTTQFSNHKDLHYRQQLQAIQVDIGLILHVDPYSQDPLEDLEPDIEKMVHQMTGGDSSFLTPLQEKNLAGVSGRLFAEFANKVRDAMEERDTSITNNSNEYEKKMSELHTSTVFLEKLASEEHKALSGSLRDRLINNVAFRKHKLNKDKEVETITDSNAHLLHPNQFVIGVPGSPSGGHGKRATRGRKDLDDLPTLLDGNKRKRKAVDEGSPSPAKRLLESHDSPDDSSFFSIEKLFTEKELTMTYNAAAYAAQEYIVSHKLKGDAGDSSSSSDRGDGENGQEANIEDDTPASPPAAIPMERQSSHQLRSSRGTGGLGSGLGINHFITPTNVEVYSDLENQSSFNRLAALLPKMPPTISSLMTKSYTKEGANQPSSINTDDAVDDIKRIRQQKLQNSASGMGQTIARSASDSDTTRMTERKILQAAVAKPGEYPIWVQAERKGEDKVKSSLSNLAAVPMSNQSSVMGSEGGGVLMSREGSRRRPRGG